MSKLKVLGIDPGFANIGIFGMTLSMGMKAEFAKLILTEKHNHGSEGQYADEMRRLDEIEVAFDAILDEFQPDLVAAERTASLRNAQATRQLAFAFGAMHHAARRRGLTVLIFNPEDIKAELTNDRKADKAKMARALIGLFPAFKGWPELGSRKRKTKNAKITATDSVAHVVDAAGACVTARRHPIIMSLMRKLSSAPTV